MHGGVYRMGLAIALFVAGTAWAGGGPGAVRRQIEASVLVTGMVGIAADGSVSGYVVDDAAKLPAGVAETLADNVPKWRFEPVLVDGRPADVRTRMSVRIVARPLDGDRVALSIGNASFGEYVPGESPWSERLAPPRYPDRALSAGVTASVYLLLRIGRDGAVQEAVAEQVNLRAVGNEREMEKLRDMFARGAVFGAKKWRFTAPTKGPDVDAPYWSVRVPVDFAIEGMPKKGKYDWQSYIPGPVTTPAWAAPGDKGGVAGPDTLAAGQVHPVNGGPRLLTPLDRG